MIVTIYDNDFDYRLTDNTENLCYGLGYSIDVTQKFLDRYKAYEAEQEFIQSKLHKYYTEAREKELLKQCETGIPSKGFD